HRVREVTVTIARPLRRLAAITFALTAVLLLSAGSVPRKSNQSRAILVSIKERHLWYVVNQHVVMDAPVAIGLQQNFVYHGKTYDFSTPRGERRILMKVPDPTWTVPLWHYYEKATEQNLDVVTIEAGRIYALADSTFIQVRDNQVGRVNRYGNYWPFTPGMEIIFDHKIFIPPMGTVQRQVKGVLGPFKLDMGGGYLIHGTHEDNEDSIGQAVSHGCIRMHNDDLATLYNLVPVGTQVFIY
ncbi:MAG TPA: L,D-transpeptidase, partial [Longimicrobiales bacterium]